MSSPACAALLVIATCAVLQALGLSVQLRPDHGRADTLPGPGDQCDGTGEFGLLLHRTSPPTSKIRQG